MKDPLGDRMKDFYEDRTRYKLARRTNTIIVARCYAHRRVTHCFNGNFGEITAPGQAAGARSMIIAI